MTLATFAALIAVLEFVIGVPLMVKPEKATRWMTDYVKDEVTYRVSGVLMLALCVVVLMHEPEVTWDLAGVMRLMALVTGLKGLVICWWPHHHEHIIERAMSTPGRQRLVGLLALIVSGLCACAACLLWT